MADPALDFPWAAPPGAGESVEVAPGVHWFVTPLPFRLNAINLWLIEDGDGWTMVDCGFPLSAVRTQIEAVWARLLDGRPLTRLIVTHHHPDHIGNAAWICARWNIVPSFTAAEWRRGQWLLTLDDGEHLAATRAFYRRHGLAGDVVDGISTAWSRYRPHFQALPADWHSLVADDMLTIGGRPWRVRVGTGHSPEQALLQCDDLGVLIAGDQVLPGISPNVSVFPDEPLADPLAAFLESCRTLAENCPPDVLVLPSHGRPFRGLAHRLAGLRIHHRDRLVRIADQLNETPCPAAALLPTLFGDLDSHQLGFAMGEVVAHLNHLAGQGMVDPVVCAETAVVWWHPSPQRHPPPSAQARCH